MSHKFKELINGAKSILITSHTSPDPDALSSLLLLGTTLKTNFTDKKIIMALEEKPEGLDFLESYSDVRFGALTTATTDAKPELFIMVDVGNLNRASRQGGPELGEYIKNNGVKTMIIDHHEPSGHDSVDEYINSLAPATVQEIYELCFKDLGLTKPSGYAQTTMLGLYSDTGGFSYLNPEQAATFDLVKELLAEDVNIEAIKNKLNQFSESQMAVISQLAANIAHSDEYSYSFLGDDFVKQWLDANSSAAKLSLATKSFIDSYIRNIDGRTWGFIAYRDVLDGDNTYSVSFRAIHGSKDVASIAATLGGGGHKAAAGAKVQAANVEEALARIKSAINETK